MADGICQQRIGQQLAPARAGRDQFRHHAIPVRDQDGLPARRQADVFAEPVLEHLQPDGSHATKVASRRYLVKSLTVAGSRPRRRHALRRWPVARACQGETVRMAAGSMSIATRRMFGPASSDHGVWAARLTAAESREKISGIPVTQEASSP